MKKRLMLLVVVLVSLSVGTLIGGYFNKSRRAKLQQQLLDVKKKNAQLNMQAFMATRRYLVFGRATAKCVHEELPEVLRKNMIKCVMCNAFGRGCAVSGNIK